MEFSQRSSMLTFPVDFSKVKLLKEVFLDLWTLTSVIFGVSIVKQTNWKKSISPGKGVKPHQPLS